MFNIIKKLFCSTRIIERFKTMEDIQKWHNRLINLLIDVSAEMSPSYLCYRLNAIMESEKKAEKAFWKNKARGRDVWRDLGEKVQPKAEESDKQANTLKQLQEGAEGQTKALNGAIQMEIAANEPLEAVQPPQETAANVIEIHINK